MMNIELKLTEEEKDVIKKALEAYVSDLNLEIANTDKMDYRDKLKKNRTILNKVLTLLQEAEEYS